MVTHITNERFSNQATQTWYLLQGGGGGGGTGPGKLQSTMQGGFTIIFFVGVELCLTCASAPEVDTTPKVTINAAKVSTLIPSLPGLIFSIREILPGDKCSDKHARERYPMPDIFEIDLKFEIPASTKTFIGQFF